MLGLFFKDRVDLVHNGPTGQKDRLGKDVVGEVSRDRAVRALLQQVGSAEGEEYVKDAWRLYLPARTELRAADAVVEGSRRFTVDGSPESVSLPGFPALRFVVARLNYVGG